MDRGQNAIYILILHYNYYSYFWAAVFNMGSLLVPARVKRHEPTHGRRTQLLIFSSTDMRIRSLSRTKETATLKPDPLCLVHEYKFFC